MRPETVDTLANHLERYGHVVEIGIGRRSAVAAELVDRGVAVTATDIVERQTPAGVSFHRDDVTDPDCAVYDGADALFAQNLPGELHAPVTRLARTVDAACLFTTLGGEQPLVDVERETLPRETLFVVRPTDDA